MGLKRSCAIIVFLLAATILLVSCVGGDREAGKFIADPIDTTTPGTWNTDYVRDYNYAEGRIFDLFYPVEEVGPYDQVQVVICEEETRLDNPEAKEVYMQGGPMDPGGNWDTPNVRVRDITDDGGWELYRTNDPLRSPWAIVFYESKRRALGVRILVTRSDDTVLTVGYAGTGGGDMDTLRVLQPLTQDMIPENPAWGLMWRNCYRVPRGLLIPELRIEIFKGLPGTEGADSNLDYQEVGGVAGDPYIQILGLDQIINNHGSMRLPDGMIDPFVDIHNPDWGLVIFLHREPFNTDTTFENWRGEDSDELADKVPTLYNYLSRSEKISISKYYLQIHTWRPDYIR